MVENKESSLILLHHPYPTNKDILILSPMIILLHFFNTLTNIYSLLQLYYLCPNSDPHLLPGLLQTFPNWSVSSHAFLQWILLKLTRRICLKQKWNTSITFLESISGYPLSTYFSSATTDMRIWWRKQWGNIISILEFYTCKNDLPKVRKNRFLQTYKD